MTLSKRNRLRRARRLSIERFERRDLLTTLELIAIADNTLYEDATGSLSNGAGDFLFAGRIAPKGGGDLRRGLIRFDLADLPAGASINSVSVELNMSRTIAGSVPVSLHNVLADWGEGASNAPGREGKGATAEADDATWLHTKFSNTTWSTAGGDFTSAASATVQVGGTGKYTWSSAQLATDVASWVSNPAANFGWIVIGDEASTTTAKRFDSRENNTAANRPKLIIDFDSGDTTSPTPTITGPAGPTASDPFDVTIAFDEAVIGFVAGDITVAGGSVTNLVDNGNGNFTATIDAAADGNVTVDIAADVATDTAGNANNAASQFSTTVDTTPPTPTITGPASPINSERFNVTVVFAETVAGFTAGDITVTGGAVNGLVDNGSGNFTATIDAAADGVVTVDVAAGVATDTAGNANDAAAQFSLTVDATGPTPTITGPASPTASEPFDVTIAFGETVSGFTADDIAVAGGSVTNLVDSGDGNFAATIDAASDGDVTVGVPAAAATDSNGNPNVAATQFSITIDTTGPTPIITGPTSPTSSETFDVTIAFGETVTGFVLGDITVTGGNVSNLVNNGGGVFTAAIDATAGGVVAIDVAAGVAADLAGNDNFAATRFSVTVDTTGPTPVITGPGSPTSGNPFDVTIAFGESVTGFESNDITVSGGSVTNLVDNGSGDFTATIDATDDGDVTVDVAAGVAADTAGNANGEAAQFAIAVDTTGPTPVITGPAGARSNEPFDLTIAFAETVSDFVVDDITVAGGSVTNLTDDGAGSFTATVNAPTAGDVTVDINAGVATDTAGNDNNAAAQFSITVAAGNPIPKISGPTDPTGNDPFDVTIDFAESVTGFVADDITVAGGSVADLTDNGDGKFNATIDASDDGVVTVDIAADVASDATGDPNLAATQFSITVDTTGPTPTITGPDGPTTSDQFDVTIDFAETVTGFETDDIAVAGGSVTNLVDNGSGDFTATVEATTDGDVTVDVPAGVATDAAGNVNDAGEQFSITVEARSDFGDAPTAAQSGFANDYPVTRIQNGALHSVGTLILGSLIDAEADGLPTADAGGDGADDDGVIFVTSLVAVQKPTASSLSAVASAAGLLDAWIDFNQNGDWDDAGEQILSSASVTAGENVLPFTVPADASPGTTAARFRLSTAGGLAATGTADDGEVEDYLVTILDGDSSPEVAVELVGDVLAVSAESGEIVLRAGETERFRAPATSVGSISIVGTASDDSLSLNLGGGFEIPSGGLQFTGGSGNNTLSIDGPGGSIDLTQPGIDASDFTQIDLSSEDESRLTLDAGVVATLAPSTKLIEIVAAEGDQIVVGQAPDWRMTDPVVLDGQFHLTALHQEGDDERIQARVAHPWQNFLRPSDVNNDGSVSALDALVIINELGPQRFTQSTGDLLEPLDVPVWPDLYFDQNGDDRASALDALRVINELASQPRAGESNEAEFIQTSLHETSSGRAIVDEPGLQLLVRSAPDSAATLAADTVIVAIAADSPPNQEVADGFTGGPLSLSDVDQLFADDSFLSDRG